MVRSVEDILKKEFGRSLSDKDVHILDPFVGTGNFITRVMKEIKTSALPYKYEHELHCNEIMLLPYYVASMNIEHEYLERTGEYKPFPGICLVDTFDMRLQSVAVYGGEFRAPPAARRSPPIFVVIGNPPYNAGSSTKTTITRIGNTSFSTEEFRRLTQGYRGQQTKMLFRIFMSKHFDGRPTDSATMALSHLSPTMASWRPRLLTACAESFVRVSPLYIT